MTISLQAVASEYLIDVPALIASETGTPDLTDRNPATLNTIKPARKLVPHVATGAMIASL